VVRKLFWDPTKASGIKKGWYCRWPAERSIAA